MQESVSENLLEKLCSAVHKVQEEYASGNDVIRDGDAVNHLCQSVDDILSHGLKEGILHWASASEATYWPIASRITYREVVQDILSRQELKNDRERCYIWLRLAVQENALGSYLNVITQDDKLQREFYHPHAFVCDKEKVETAKTALLYGLSHLDFNISIGIPQDFQGTSPTRPHKSGSLTEHFPAKPILINGYDTHPSPDSTYTDHGSVTSTDSLTRPQDGAKKKKRKKKPAGVAVIADNFDECMLPTIERYLSLSEKDSGGDSPINTTYGRPMDSGNEDTNSLDRKHPETPEPIPVSEEELLSKAFSAHTSLERENADSTDNTNHVSYSTGNVEERIFKKENHEQSFVSQSHNQEKNYRTEALGDAETTQPQTGEEKSTLLSSTPVDDSISHQEEAITSRDAIDDSLNDDYKVSTAIFEFGTPKEVSFVDEMGGDTSFASNEETEDLNFVPGIHKTREHLSRSSSLSSFTGSGSFSNGQKATTEKTRRSSTVDSSRTNNSSAGGSLPSDSWKYVTNYFSGAIRKDSKADDVNSVNTEDSFSDLGIFDELLGIDEDHYSPPESFMGFTSSEELQIAIQSCKGLIRKAPEKSTERKKLVEKLIQLRVRLQDTRDAHQPDEDNTNTNTKKVLGHNFMKEQGPGVSNHLCDRCGKWIWTMWQSLFTCQACKFHSHRKCLHTIRRPCASRKVSTVSSYTVAICPESGLSTQQYKCAECRKRISLNKGDTSEARLCDYSGQYFCDECHWNDQIVIPARIVHNWDFTSYKVACQNKQLLSLMLNKPQLNLEHLNPALFKFVGELREIKRLREEILIMKKYFMSCRAALESKLLLHLQGRQHFVDNSYQYSLQDVIDVERGSLLPFITRVHSLFLTHIKTDCQLCQAKGFVCELCKAKEVIFAFDPHAVQCPKCRTVLHKVCLKFETCPKCERRQKLRTKK